MSASFLRLVEVSKSFNGRKVVDGISLEVIEGESLALLGASGCGKTTTLRLIAGLEVPDAGEIFLDGERVAVARRHLVAAHRRKIGFVFQDLALWSHLTIEGNLAFVLTSVGVAKNECAHRIEEALRLVHIEQFAASYPAQLSGGEQQRAAIARALVGRPRLLLLDEPLSSLDTDLKSELRRELAALQARLGITTIHITHDHAEAHSLADKVMLMRDGRIERVEQGERGRTNGQSNRTCKVDHR